MADIEAKRKAIEWVSHAREDAYVAEQLIQLPCVPFSTVCYHCQQAAEKYLKAVLEAHGEKLPRTHDLVLLNTMCSAYDASFLSLNEHCADLTPYETTARYPFIAGYIPADIEDVMEEYAKMRAIEAHVSCYIEKHITHTASQAENA